MSALRSSLAPFSAAGRDPDPVQGRRAAADAWHREGVLLIRPEWLASWADRKQAELLAEKVHGRRKGVLSPRKGPEPERGR